MFIINLTYVKELKEVDDYLAPHIGYLNKYYEEGNFICSGRKNPRDGGVILCNAKSKEEVDEIIKKDPFYKNGIATYDITEFLPTKHVKGFGAFTSIK